LIYDFPFPIIVNSVVGADRGEYAKTVTAENDRIYG
jgi:hypothetical protein